MQVKHSGLPEADLTEEMDRMRAFFTDRIANGLKLTSLLLLGNTSVVRLNVYRCVSISPSRRGLYRACHAVSHL